MKRFVRPSTPADAPAIVALFTQAGLRPNTDPRSLQWKYWQERADWPGARAFVLTQGSDLIAHGALVPGTFAWGTHRERTGHVIDWVARSGEIGAGVAIMKHIGKQVDSLFAIGGTEATLRLLPHIGFRAAGAATGYVRPLFPWRMYRDAGAPIWRALPRFARNTVWKHLAPAAVSRGWQSHHITGSGDLDRLASVLPAPRGTMTLLERGIELFRYVLSCPIVPMQLFGVGLDGQAKGYFLLASTPGQVRIVDCWVDSIQPGDWRAMILCAVQQASHDAQAAEVVIWASDPLLALALGASGFHARGKALLQVSSPAGAALPPLPIRVQLLDNDAAYLNEGHPLLWA